ncbi:MAG: NADH-quinone oxidoreductase subunit M [Magnetococcales bacterium]|nr:NADH-quinone oxidoreductase subunit M [Magnetococcales bacterium]
MNPVDLASASASASGWPLLTLLIVLPMAAATGMRLVPHPRQARWAALLVALAEGVLACWIAAGVDPARAEFQQEEWAAWIPSLNIHYHVGVDGLSALFPPLTALLFIGVIVASWNAVQTLPRLHFALLLLLEGATMGVYLSLDLVLFFLFWELTLIPLYFLVSLWGVGPYRRYAANKYTLLMLTGGVPLLFGILLAASLHAGGEGAPASAWVFDLPTLMVQALPVEAQIPVFLLLFFGFAFKTPLFPLHTWLPTAAMEGPAGVAALLTGLKLGAYGILRVAIPLAPQGAMEMHWLLAGLGVFGIVYGALIALTQTNLRRMLAYSSISHVGMVVLAISSLTLEGVQGALFQLLNFPLAAGGIFLLAGWIQQRIGSTDWIHLGGLARGMPMAAVFFLFLGLTGMGMPGTSGFPAELLMLLGVFHTYTGAGLAALGGQILAAGYFLTAYRRAFFGPLTQPGPRQAKDLLSRELALMVVFSLVILAAGLHPALVLDFTRAASEAWIARLSPL